MITSYNKGEAEFFHCPLCLLVADNSAESICLYCYFIKEKIPFLLVDVSTSKERLQQIIHYFQPAYLFVSEGEGDFSPSSDYGRKEVYRHYVCWRFSLDELQEELQREQKAVCVNGSGAGADRIGVVIEKSASGETEGNEEDNAWKDTLIREQVDLFFQKRHIPKSDYDVVIIEEIPRRSNGKVDYQKAKEFFS